MPMVRSEQMRSEDQQEPEARVPDDKLDFDSDLIYYYEGRPFTGTGYSQDPGHGLSEISYVNGLQEGVSRDW